MLTLQDVDPIVAEIQLNNDDPIEVNLDRNKGPKSVSFDIYVSETGRSNQGLKDNTVLDQVYKKILFGSDADPTKNLLGWFVLESPSGYKTKVIPINYEDKVKPEKFWSDSYPNIAKYSPRVEFTTSDEHGRWRLTQFIHFHPDLRSIGANENREYIHANTTDYRDGQASA